MNGNGGEPSVRKKQRSVCPSFSRIHRRTAYLGIRRKKHMFNPTLGCTLADCPPEHLKTVRNRPVIQQAH
jgi:hypothetical protein